MASRAQAADRAPHAFPAGFRHLKGAFDVAAQRALLQALRRVISEAPLTRPEMPGSGRALSVLMTNCGELGWVSDRSGYRYQARHPETDNPWPVIPREISAIWEEVSGVRAAAEACLINYYAEGARLGLHQDKDEEDFSAPVVSISLGDKARFQIGGLSRRDKLRALELSSGDVVVLAGEARLAYHSIARIYSGSSDLLAEGGRFNITLRRVTRAGAQVSF